jgi:uncharacterized protein YjcR
MATKRLTKKEIETKKVIAYAMYMANEDNKVIAETLEVTAKTITDWVTAGKWKTKRSAGTITRDQLVNKCLAALEKILEKATEEDADMTKLPDDLIKMANTIEKLDKKDNVVNNINSFTGFNNYLLNRMKDDSNLTAEKVKEINKLQNDYVTFRING